MKVYTDDLEDSCAWVIFQTFFSICERTLIRSVARSLWGVLKCLRSGLQETRVVTGHCRTLEKWFFFTFYCSITVVPIFPTLLSPALPTPYLSHSILPPIVFVHESFTHVPRKGSLLSHYCTERFKYLMISVTVLVGTN